MITSKSKFISKLSGYFYTTAYNIDRFANYEFRNLWNLILIDKNSKYKFGNFNQTISYCLGMNKKYNSLSKTGSLLCTILNFFDKNHVEKAIEIK